MEVGGCGVPEDGGFPMALGSKVLREVVVPVVASPGAEDMGGGSSPSPSPSPSTSPTAGVGAKRCGCMGAWRGLLVAHVRGKRAHSFCVSLSSPD